MIDRARAVADAVLYEGFLLFPYRKDALKNQLPWQFGVLMPQGYADASEARSFTSEMTLLPGDGAIPQDDKLDVLVRFLQATEAAPIEREVALQAGLAQPHTETQFAFDRLSGTVTLDVTPEENGVLLLTLAVRNTASMHPNADRNEALRSAFISAHALLSAHSAVFASLLDPPDIAKPVAARCTNERVFPVLTGEPADATNQTARTVLVSPIILYDFPRIANASTTHTFDATEIDELLMLSVASLSEDEKHAARAAHPYVRQLVERADALDADTLATLHGELTGHPRDPGDETVTIAGAEVRKGSRVRVHPKRRADVWDSIVDGMTGRVCAVHTDAEGKRYVGVVFDGDPASELHEWYGRSFFYAPDEVEPQ
jgi:hypothetical protein